MNDNCGSSSHRKKKQKVTDWVASTFNNTSDFKEQVPPAKKRKFSRHTSSESFNQSRLSVSHSKQWHEQHSPICTEELAVHKKKISDVEQWLTNAFRTDTNKRRSSILIMTGPTGSGKTITLKLLAEKHKLNVEEWINPVTSSFEVKKEAGLRFESQTLQFNEFLFRCGKYSSVIDESETKFEENSKRKVLLLEDFPNFVLRNPSELQPIIKRYYLMKGSPLVVILSDGKSSENIKRQFRDPAIKSCCHQISFNPISTTLMQKALKRVSLSECKSLNKEDMIELITLANGDIRAAINSLQFHSLGIRDDKWKKAAKKATNMCMNTRDKSIFLFRALGKIFYCKRTPPVTEPSASNMESYRDPLVTQPEDVLDQCCLSGPTFSAFLHHNYINFFNKNPLEDLASAAQYLSDGDVMNSYQDSVDMSSGSAVKLEQYEGMIASRGMIFSNSLRATSHLCSTSTGTWRPMHKPACFEVAKKRRENYANGHTLFWKFRQSPQELILSTLPFLVKFPRNNQFIANSCQRCFLDDVVSLPITKSFISKEVDSKVGENEEGSHNCTTIDFKDKEVLKAVEDSSEEVEEDIEIEDFSD